MRTIPCVGFMLTVTGLLVGCSSDGERQRPNGTGGTPSVLGTGGQETDAGTAAGAGGTAGGPSLKRGEVLEFVVGPGEVPYAIGDNAYGIHGGAFLARSALGNTVTIANDPGKICIRGSLDEVPNGNYGQYWGIEIGFNLNQGAPGTSTGIVVDAGADAATGADAAPPTDVALPWVPGTVVGFSFVIEGPTINLIRFKALPSGFDATLESSVYCKSVTATSGDVQDALFTQMKQYCWNATANVLIPTGSGLANISWQLPADVAVGARPFDWCLKDLRPILAQ